MEPEITNRERNRSHGLETPRWWLPLGLGISVAVHALLVIGIARFGPSSPSDAATGDQALVHLVKSVPVAPKAVSPSVARPIARALPQIPSKVPEPIRARRAQEEHRLQNREAGIAPVAPSPLPEPQPETPTAFTPIASATPVAAGEEESGSRLAALPDASPSPPTNEVTATEVGRALPEDSPATFSVAVGGTAQTGVNLGPASPTPPEVSAVRGVPFPTNRGRNLDGPPVHIVYLIDVSGSMEEEGKMERVRVAMAQALSELRPGDFFNLVYFSARPQVFSHALCPVTEDTVKAAVASLGRVTPQNATNLSAAFAAAFAQTGITHLCLISDGEPTEGITDTEDLCNFVRRQNTGSAHLIALALAGKGPFKADPLLRRLTAENQGSFQYVLSPATGG